MQKKRWADMSAPQKIGIIIGATIQFGLVMLGMQPFWQFLAVGLVVIIAVIVDQFGRTLER